MDDAATLRSAAIILQQRSTKPNGLWMKALMQLMEDTAAKIDAAPPPPPTPRPTDPGR